MTSTIGVPTLYQVSPHLKSSKPTTKKKTCFFNRLPLSKSYFRHSSSSLLLPSAVAATPNSILSLGLPDYEVNKENFSDDAISSSDELSVSKLGLPQQLAEGIKLYAISATSTSKRNILIDLITVYAKGGKTIVFTQTKRDADEVSLALSNSIASESLHGDISQHQREITLNGFKLGNFTVLVATDVVSRGLDIPNVDLIIHYEVPNDPETFVHRSGRTEGSTILMFTSSQRRRVMSLESDVGCRFEFISPPTVEKVLEASADQVVATLNGVHSESVEFFSEAAQRLFEEKGVDALAAALAYLSGFSQPPSSRSLISHEQGWVTLQLTRDTTYSRGFLSTRSVTGFLSDVDHTAADEVGKIFLIADDKVQGAVFDLPEEIAQELLEKELPPGNSIAKITKLPTLQEKDHQAIAMTSFLVETGYLEEALEDHDQDIVVEEVVEVAVGLVVQAELLYEEGGGKSRAVLVYVFLLLLSLCTSGS